MSTIDAVLCDMNGLFRHWQNTGAATGEQAAGLLPHTIATYAYDHVSYRLARVGVLTDQEWADDVTARLTADFGPAAKDAITPWREDRGIPDQTMISILGALRQHLPVGVLSNCTDALRDDLLRHGIAFDHVFPSAEIGVEKPAPLAYLTATAAMNVLPARVAFWDDQPYFVTAARHAGLKAHLFTGPDAFLRDLAEYGYDLRNDPTLILTDTHTP